MSDEPNVGDGQESERFETSASLAALPFRLSVSYSRDGGQRVGGRVASGRVTPGDRIALLSGGLEATVSRVLRSDDPIERAGPGETVTIVVDPPLTEARAGDLLSASEKRPEMTDQFAASVEWLGASPLFPGRTYRLRHLEAWADAQVTAIKSLAEPSSSEHAVARTVMQGQNAVCNFALDRPIPIEPFTANPGTGAFSLEAEETGEVLARGRVAFALRRAANIHWQVLKVDKAARAKASGHRPCVLWFTGLSGSGKTTIADLVEQKLHARGIRTMSLDGDNVRHGLNRDLGFTDADRVENIRRIAEVAKLMTEAGLVTLVSFISPFRSERQMARDLVETDEFLEIFVDTPLALCEQRDPKGLYRKARAGRLPNFTGIDSPYEPPIRPEVHLQTAVMPADEAAEQIVSRLSART